MRHDVAGAKFGVVLVMAISMMLARCTGSVSSPATTRATAGIHVTARTQVRVTPTAVTGAAGDLWLLGTYPCSTGSCSAIMRSTDGGKLFVRVGSLPMWVATLMFANREDGYAYFPGPDIRTRIVYWTDDSGKSWQRVLTQIPGSLASPIVTSGGRAYVLVSKDCSTHGCKSLDIASSAVTGDGWTARPLPLTAHEVNSDVGLAALGSKVWIIVAAAGENAAVLVSDDGGRTFTNLPSRGMEGGLDCTATATSAMTIWGFCATGLEGYGVRSTDGGRDFTTMSGWKDGAANGGVVLPLSDTEAIFLPGGPDTWLTRDGGRHFSPLLHFPNPSSHSEIAVAGKATWLDLTPDEPHPLLRTTNGGQSWQSVKALNV